MEHDKASGREELFISSGRRNTDCLVYSVSSRTAGPSGLRKSMEVVPRGRQQRLARQLFGSFCSGSNCDGMAGGCIPGPRAVWKFDAANTLHMQLKQKRGGQFELLLAGANGKKPQVLGRSDALAEMEPRGPRPSHLLGESALSHVVRMQCR